MYPSLLDFQQYKILSSFAKHCWLFKHPPVQSILSYYSGRQLTCKLSFRQSPELDFQNKNAVFVLDIANPSNNNLRKKPIEIIDFDPKRSPALKRDRMPPGRRSTL